MLHNERPIKLGELSNLLFTVYHLVDRLDQDLTSNKPGHISIFVSKHKEINRIAVGKCYNLINEVRDRNQLQTDVFLYFNKPTQDLLERIDLIKQEVNDYFQNDRKSNYLSITTSLFGELAGYLSFLVHSFFELCITYEVSQLKIMDFQERVETLMRKIQRIEDLKLYNSGSTNDVYQLFLDRQLEIFNSLYTKTNSNSKTNLKEESSALFDAVFQAAKMTQGQKKNINSGEKPRTQIFATYIQKYIAKDESGYGISEKGKTIGETDIKIENHLGEVVSICEGFNLDHSWNTKKITTHVQKLAGYDANGLENNFVLVFYSLCNFNNDFIRYQNLIEKIDVMSMDLVSCNEYDFNARPAKIKTLCVQYSLNFKDIKVFHFFIDMN